MPQRNLEVVQNINQGGIADSIVSGFPNSVADALCIDMHSEPGLIKVNQKMKDVEPTGSSDDTQWGTSFISQRGRLFVLSNIADNGSDTWYSDVEDGDVSFRKVSTESSAFNQSEHITGISREKRDGYNWVINAINFRNAVYYTTLKGVFKVDYERQEDGTLMDKDELEIESVLNLGDVPATGSNGVVDTESPTQNIRSFNSNDVNVKNIENTPMIVIDDRLYIGFDNKILSIQKRAGGIITSTQDDYDIGDIVRTFQDVGSVLKRRVYRYYQIVNSGSFNELRDYDWWQRENDGDNTRSAENRLAIEVYPYEIRDALNENSFEDKYVIHCFAEINGNLIIGCKNKTGENETRIFTWNTVNQKYQISDPVPHNRVNAFIPIDNGVIFSAGHDGSLYTYNAQTGKAQLYNKIALTDKSNPLNKVCADPQAVLDFNGKGLIGMCKMGGSPKNLDIYSLARYNANYPYILNREYRLDGYEDDWNVKYLFLAPYGIDRFLVAYRRGEEGSYKYGLQVLDLENKFDKAYFTTRLIQLGTNRARKGIFLSAGMWDQPAETGITLSQISPNKKDHEEVLDTRDMRGANAIQARRLDEALGTQIKTTFFSHGNQAPIMLSLMFEW